MLKRDNVRFVNCRVNLIVKIKGKDFPLGGINIYLRFFS